MNPRIFLPKKIWYYRCTKFRTVGTTWKGYATCNSLKQGETFEVKVNLFNKGVCFVMFSLWNFIFCLLQFWKLPVYDTGIWYRNPFKQRKVRFENLQKKQYVQSHLCKQKKKQKKTHKTCSLKSVVDWVEKILLPGKPKVKLKFFYCGHDL